MEMMPVKPERKAQLESYAKEHEQSVADALDDLLAAQLEADQREYDETVRGALRGYEDVKAGRTSSGEEVFAQLIRFTTCSREHFPNHPPLSTYEHPA